jgi:hypothetical protein
MDLSTPEYINIIKDYKDNPGDSFTGQGYFYYQSLIYCVDNDYIEPITRDLYNSFIYSVKYTSPFHIDFTTGKYDNLRFTTTHKGIRHLLAQSSFNDLWEEHVDHNA